MDEGKNWRQTQGIEILSLTKDQCQTESQCQVFNFQQNFIAIYDTKKLKGTKRTLLSNFVHGLYRSKLITVKVLFSLYQINQKLQIMTIVQKSIRKREVILPKLLPLYYTTMLPNTTTMRLEKRVASKQDTSESKQKQQASKQQDTSESKQQHSST